MSGRRLSFNAVAAVALRDVFTHPSYWLPALVLLTPTLVVQLAVPSYLRTRLAPATWTVAAGAVLLVWLAQVALPAACALVHARRVGTGRTLDLPLVRLSLVIGTRVTLGLAAAVLPGLWLQARYAFVPLLLSAGQDGPASRTLAGSTSEMRGAQRRLLLVGCAALLASALGQSAIAALAETMNTITAVGHVNGRAVFQLNLLPHVITTIAAYVWSAATFVFHALCVSALFDEAYGAALVNARACDVRGATRWVKAGQFIAAAAALGALVTAVYKVQQHLY
jgi:hypothetical protein